ncbi:MAG: ChbG/HpnK family deacetylase, partial [Coprobacillaceae bacterium]
RVGIRFHTRRLSDKQVQEYKKKIKNIPHADVFTSNFFDNNATFHFFETLPDTNETYEMMCHPAFVDYAIFHNSSYNTKRAEELYILQSPKLYKILENMNIQLISFKDL